MGECFLNQSGGGTDLNFKVVGGTTEPTNPKENMIWVNTSATIPSWIFSATEPEAPIEGMAWITVGTDSHAEFNALKKNGIQVYPHFAKQYVGGAWEEKIAKTYQGGEWVDWQSELYHYLYLYNYGDTCDSITGGWTGLSIADDGGGQWGYGGIMYTNGKVPISQYSKLVILYKWIDSGGSSGASVAITVNSGQQTSGTKYASFDFNKTTGTLHTATINIASLTADAYIRGASYYGTGRIYQVYMQ